MRASGPVVPGDKKMQSGHRDFIRTISNCSRSCRASIFRLLAVSQEISRSEPFRMVVVLFDFLPECTEVIAVIEAKWCSSVVFRWTLDVQVNCDPGSAHRYRDLAQVDRHTPLNPSQHGDG